MPYSKRPDATPTFSSDAEVTSSTSARYTPTSPVKSEPSSEKPAPLPDRETPSSGGFSIADILTGMFVIVILFLIAVFGFMAMPSPAPEPTEDTLINKSIDVAEKGIEKAPIVIENGLDNASESLDEIK